MKHLYVIGNGFDIHHGRNTNYQDFHHWLEDNKEYDTIQSIDDTFGYCDSEWWKDFEQNLASADTLNIAMDEVSENYPYIGSDDFHDSYWHDAEYAVENRLNEVYITIRDAFHRWINQLKRGNPDKKINIDVDNGIFLTFNYSDTIESLYHVPKDKILYIHGKANTKDELVLGHGVSYEDIEEGVKQEPYSYYDEDNDCIEYEGDDLVTQRAKEAAVSGVYNQRKDVNSIISKNEGWFDSLKDVTHIHIYGHSFGNVDLPYFRKIFSSVKRHCVEIEISDYQGSCKDIIDKFMEEEGFKAGKGQGHYYIMELSDIMLKY